MKDTDNNSNFFHVHVTGRIFLGLVIHRQLISIIETFRRYNGGPFDSYVLCHFTTIVLDQALRGIR